MLRLGANMSLQQTLASLDSCARDIGIHSIIVPELKFRDVQMRVFLAHLVIRPDDAALQNRPEAFDGIRMDCADDVLTGAMVNSLMREPSAVDCIPAKHRYRSG